MASQRKNVRLDIVYFGQNTQYLKNIYKVGNIFVSEKFENFNGLGQIAHPDYVVKATEKFNTILSTNLSVFFE